MTKQTEHQEDTQSQTRHDESPAGAPANTGRRRFNKAALTTAPVLYLLAHRPALGAGSCQSPSGYHSMNTSIPNQNATCDGGTPSYWRAHPEQWPSPYETGTCAEGDDAEELAGIAQSGDGVSNLNTPSAEGKLGALGLSGMAQGGCTEYHSDGTPFFSIFEFRPHFAVDHAETLTLMQVLWLSQNEDPHGLGAHMVASLLNAAYGLAPPLNESLLRKMWHDGLTGGGFVHTGGEEGWGPHEIVEYLQTTMYRSA